MAGGWVCPIPKDSKTVTIAAGCSETAWPSYFTKQACADKLAGNDGTVIYWQGMMALGSMRPLALVTHVVLGAMFAAALGAHNNAEYGDLETRCGPLY